MTVAFHLGDLIKPTFTDQCELLFNPIDPNPAISAHVVFPQSGHIRPEKQPFFQDFPHFSKIEPYKKYEPLIGVQYIILKLMKRSI